MSTTTPPQNVTRTRWTQAKALDALHVFEEKHGHLPTYQEIDNLSSEHNIPNRKALARLFGSYHKAISIAHQAR